MYNKPMGAIPSTINSRQFTVIKFKIILGCSNPYYIRIAYTRGRIHSI